MPGTPRAAFQDGTCLYKHKAPQPGRATDLDLLDTALVAAAGTTGPGRPHVDPVAGERR